MDLANTFCKLAKFSNPPPKKIVCPNVCFGMWAHFPELIKWQGPYITQRTVVLYREQIFRQWDYDALLQF